MDFSISNEIIHSLLSYISRLPTEINNATLHKIYTNNNDFGKKWVENTVKLYQDDDDENKSNHDKKFKIEIRPLYVEQNTSLENVKEDDIDYQQKMSFALMKILSNDDGPKEIKLFLNKKMQFIVFHCMLVFHPSSSGNMYHSVEILKILLKYYPLQLYQIFSNSQNYPVIHKLFQYALMSRIHEAKFGEFLLALLLYNESEKQNIAKCRTQLINNLIHWKFLENILKIGTNPVIYGEDVSNKYCGVITTLLKQCATMNETVPLFNNGDQNMLAFIIQTFIKCGLDKTKNKWYRIHCIQMVIQTLTDLCDTKVVERKNQRKKIIKSSDNYLYSSFNEALKTLNKFIVLIGNEIININSNDIIDIKSRSKKPLGLYRLKCMKLLMLYIDLCLKQKMKFNELCITNLNDLCKNLIDMALIHINNNLFLVQFRKFIIILDKYDIDSLKYMIDDCKMLQRFIEFYNKDNIQSALKSFILIILWDLKQSSGKNKKWNFSTFAESDNNAKVFMSLVSKQIALQQPKKV